jgi:hypothetical protein
MIIAIVTFNLGKTVTLDQATKMFESTAPRYQGLPGLVRKNYVLSEDGSRSGGIYLWETRADAERAFNDEWRKTMTEKYGAAPSVEYLESPVMVDNVDGKISVAA